MVYRVYSALIRGAGMVFCIRIAPIGYSKVLKFYSFVSIYLRMFDKSSTFVLFLWEWLWFFGGTKIYLSTLYPPCIHLTLFCYPLGIYSISTRCTH